jgi:hypothetical protein
VTELITTLADLSERLAQLVIEDWMPVPAKRCVVRCVAHGRSWYIQRDSIHYIYARPSDGGQPVIRVDIATSVIVELVKLATKQA